MMLSLIMAVAGKAQTLAFPTAEGFGTPLLLQSKEVLIRASFPLIWIPVEMQILLGENIPL